MNDPHQLGPSGEASVLLEIGGEQGALVLRTEPDLLGVELDLDPLDQGGIHVHSAVRERDLPGGSAFAAIYPSLPAGGYCVADSGQVVLIEGGRVTEAEFVRVPAPA